MNRCFRITLLLTATIAAQAGGTDAVSVDYLVITRNALAPAFEDFAYWKTRKGFRTEVVPVESVYAHFPGRDSAEKIRNFIKLYKDSLGTQWVLLAGEVEHVPTRMAHTPYNLTEFSPCDMYFSDLDGDWDFNGNSIFGEQADSIDFYADVFVGRAPVVTITQVQTLTAKWLEFEKNPESDYLRKLLQVGDSSNLGAPPDWFVAQLLDPVGRYQFPDSLNAGFQFAWHLGHGNADVLMVSTQTVLTSTDARHLTNHNRLNVFLTVGSMAGAYDQDCIGSCLLLNPNGGSVAVLANSRAGRTPRTQTLSRDFFSNLFQTDTCYEVGRNCARAKDKHVLEARTDMYWRQSLYVWNLLGEPNLPCWTDTVKTLTITHPAVIDTGPHDFQVTILSGGTPVRAFVCLWKENEVYERIWLEGSGTIPIHPRTPGQMLVTVTSPNHRPYEASCGITTAVRERPAAKVKPQIRVTGGRQLVVRVPAAAVVDVFDATGRKESGPIRVQPDVPALLPAEDGVKLVRLRLPDIVVYRKVIVVR